LIFAHGEGCGAAGGSLREVDGGGVKFKSNSQAIQRFR
jgi:hypothetical protein